MGITVRRLIRYSKLEFSGDNQRKLVLILKYDFDETNLVDYKQIALKEDRKLVFIMCTSFVPSKLNDKDTGQILGANEHPSSTSLCRPIEIDFQKTTEEFSRAKQEAMLQEIDELNVELPGFSVEFDLRLIIVHGKVSH